MPYNKPVFKMDFECMKDIELIVRARLLRTAKISVQIYTMGGQHDTPSLWHMSFTPPSMGSEERKGEEIVTEPGIPPDSITPERIGPIAYWIINQVRAKRPEWFIKGDIVYRQ